MEIYKFNKPYLYSDSCRKDYLQKLENIIDLSDIIKNLCEEEEKYVRNFKSEYVIRKDVGEYYCPHCEEKLKTFWAEFLYCPYCSRQLVWNKKEMIQASESEEE